MFDRLIDVLLEFIQLGQVYVFVDEFDEAVVLRGGKYHRTVGPGPHWVWPLNIEDLIDVNVKPAPIYTSNQSVHSSDDFLLNVQVGASIKVCDARTYLLEYEETEALIVLALEGYVAEAIRSHTYRECATSVWLQGVQRKANRYAKVRGAKLSDIVVIDLASGDANKLWVEGVELGD